MDLKEFFSEIADNMIYFNKKEANNLKAQNYYAQNAMNDYYKVFLPKIMKD